LPRVAPLVMAKKALGQNVSRGLKKSNQKASKQHYQGKAELHLRAPGLSKSNAGSFLKDRLNKKVKDLRCRDHLDTLQENASSRGELFLKEEEEAAEAESSEGEALLNEHREADNTRKKFYSELRKVIANADVIIEVLDARDPGSCRCMDLEKDVLAAGKKLVLLINKIDLVPKHAVAAWKEHLQRSFPVVIFKAARSGAHRPVQAMTSAENAPEGLLRSTHGVVGADELMQLLKNYSRMNGSQAKFHTMVGIVGYPNTGKSSIINSMKRHNSVQVGGRAGVTRVAQEVPLDKKVTLIDTPGVVFAGSSEDPAVVLRNVVRVELLSDPEGVVDALIKKVPRESLLEFYEADKDFASSQDFLIHVAQMRNKMRQGHGGGGLDLRLAAVSVIQDWVTGRFRYFVMPPAVAEGAVTAAEAETADVVSSLAPAFDIDALDGDDAAMGGALAQPAVLGAPLQGGDDDDGMDCEDGGGMVQVDN